MPPKGKNVVADFIQIDSSEDEDDGRGSTAPSGLVASTSMPQPQLRGVSSAIPPPVVPGETLACRSFWKAGDYAVGPTSAASAAPGLLEHARVHPKFLHSNATSHRWAFGAIAELLDNAVDEIQNGATFVKVDKIDIVKDNSPALVFQDDGGGMDPEGIRKCMSLGYSSKKSNTTIGQYGNGFKTSTMRLGADVIVFSRATRQGKATQSVGLLSYTFLRRTGQDDVIVPMIDFDISSHWAEPILYGSQEDWSANLNVILEWSPFASKEELMRQFEDVGSHGTKVIIYNLWLNDEGIYELSLDDDDEDIRLRDEANHDLKKLHKKTIELRSHISYRLRYSLRAYASVLYLKKFKNFKIILRGKPVEQFNIADELKYPRTAIYKPQGPAMGQAAAEVKIGFIKEAPSLPVCGFNVYHKNRLIRPFWKVTADGSSKGNGVVGVLEANFIEPAHDKQDFERSSLFIRLESKLKKILMDYWFGHCHIFGYQSPLMPADRTKRAAPTELPVEKAKKPSSTEQHRSHYPIIQEIRLDKATVSHPPAITPQHLTSVPGRGDFKGMQSDLEPVVTVSMDDYMPEDEPVCMSAHEIREENIQLFMRCEEYAKKETELGETVRCLEKELEEAKSKCAQLALLVEAKRKEKSLKQRASEVS